MGSGQSQSYQARAKINLTLHVGRAIADRSDPYFRYHPLDSLVVFADVADELVIRPSDSFSFEISGPFAGALPAGEDNLVLQTLRAWQRLMPTPPLAISLTKNLPIASGIGGGSADAAAMIRALDDIAPLPEDRRDALALRMGADIPVCVASETARMTGIGQNICALDLDDVLPAILVNPGVGVSTPDIFRAFDAGSPSEMPVPQSVHGGLLERTMAGTNDLEPFAVQSVPIIADVLSALRAVDGIQIARMSGSGATCFGLFPDLAGAKKGAEILRAAHPDWWIVPTRLGGSAPHS